MGAPVNQVPGAGVDLAALSELAPELAKTFVKLASDIALVIGSDGVIHNVAVGDRGALAPDADEWVGRSWADTATGETRTKIVDLLREVHRTGGSHRREINHPSPAGADIPVSYAAVRLGEGGPVLAVGRDLRTIAGIQQQFVEAQQEIEREYWKNREDESRYRLLFQVATDAVLVVDAGPLRVVDVNRAACGLFEAPAERLIGSVAGEAFDPASRPAIQELLTTARASGLPMEIRARLQGHRVAARVSAMPFRSADSMLLLVRVRSGDPGLGAGDDRSTLLQLVECTPDAVVVVDPGGRILMANPSFVELAQFTDESQARGRRVGDLAGEEIQDVISIARSRGMAQGRTLQFTGLRGRSCDVEVSAALLAEDEQERIGLTLRIRRLDTPPAAPHSRMTGEVAAAIEMLAREVGNRDLAELLAFSTVHLERLFVRSALESAHGDRARAAALLGVGTERLDALLRAGPGGDPGTGSGPSGPA